MPCAIKNCKIKSNINSRTGLCTSCDQTFSGISRRVYRQDKQTEGRDQQHAAHRGGGDMDETDHGSDFQEHSPRTTSSPAAGGQPTTATTPLVDVQSLHSSYSKMMADGSQPKIFTDMFGMMLQVVSKQTENELTKVEVKSNTNIIQELEAKVGGPKKLGLYMCGLPFPQNGQSELENVRAAIVEINGPDVDTVRDVIKAERVGSSENYFGTVKIEMRDDNSRASVMKTKKHLATHSNPIMRNLVVGNLKTNSQMALENFARDLLKLVPGGNELFVAANGHLRQRGGPPPQHASFQGHHTRQAHPRPPPAGLRPASAPSGPTYAPAAPSGPHAHAPNGAHAHAQVRQPLAPPQPRAPVHPPPRPQHFNLNFPSQSNSRIHPAYSHPSYSHPSYSQASMAPTFIPVYANASPYASPVPSTSHQADPNPLDVFDPLSQIIMPPMAPLQYRQQLPDGQLPVQEAHQGTQDDAGDRAAAQVIQAGQ